jgi:hypothetical protein
VHKLHLCQRRNTRSSAENSAGDVARSKSTGAFLHRSRGSWRFHQPRQRPSTSRKQRSNQQAGGSAQRTWTSGGFKIGRVPCMVAWSRKFWLDESEKEGGEREWSGPRAGAYGLLCRKAWNKSLEERQQGIAVHYAHSQRQRDASTHTHELNTERTVAQQAELSRTSLSFFGASVGHSKPLFIYILALFRPSGTL